MKDSTKKYLEIAALVVAILGGIYNFVVPDKDKNVSVDFSVKVGENSEQKTSQPVPPPATTQNNIDKNALYVQKFSEAMAAFDVKNFSKALTLYNEAAELNPNDPALYNNRGNTNRQLKNFDAALADYAKAIQLDPNFFMAYSNRGILQIALNNFEQAMADANSAMNLNPSFAPAYLIRGAAYTNLQNYTLAIENLNQALQLNPNYADAYQFRAICYQSLGDNAKAQVDFQKAKQLGFRPANQQ